MKKQILRTAKKQAHGKGSFAVHIVATHGKGSFAVGFAWTHSIEGWHGNAVHLCRACFLCRGSFSLFAVRPFFAVCLFHSLPCVILCRVFFFGYAVLVFFAMRSYLVARQSSLCRAVTHGIVRGHGNALFSGSVICHHEFLKLMLFKYKIREGDYIENCATKS
jgi:hypothetical protein